MTAFADAVQRLNEAEANLQAAHAIVNAAEREHGPDSAEADAAIQGPQGTACDAHGAAVEALAKIPASTAQEALLKASLLMDAGLSDKLIKAVRDDCASFVSDTKPDPTVRLCREILTITRVADERLSATWDLQVGAPDPVEMMEALAQRRRLEAELLRLTPTTAEGVALMLSVYWGIACSEVRIGSEGWEEELDRPDNMMISRMRAGAYRLAGLDA